MFTVAEGKTWVHFLYSSKGTAEVRFNSYG